MPAADTPDAAECLLCQAEKITPWYLDDELCWIAECTICVLPMVVWKSHDPDPDPATKAELHRRLGEVVGEHFTFDHWIDDEMRRIPDHYHAHARPVGGFFGGVELRRIRPIPADGDAAPDEAAS
ncbi:hypothetical protein BH24ACT4_BH24ACT4_09430 [soil metagenome]